MIDTQSPAFFAACDAFNAEPICPEYGAETALMRALEAYLAAMPKDEWRPIETAPRDDKLRVFWTKGGFEDIGSFLSEYDECPTSVHSAKFLYATHWRPLPTPPETQA